MSGEGRREWFECGGRPQPHRPVIGGGAQEAAQNEILAQREQIGELLGQVRDLQTHWTEEDLTRVVNDNSSLKKQVRQLTTENTELQNKIAAARDNVRFADKRIAALEVECAATVLP